MKEYAIRLKKNSDLKEEIERICIENSIDTAVVLSAVGCVSKVHIRLAKALEELEVEDGFEIVSLMGTISKGKAHLHVSFSDDIGNVFGGHLKSGCLVETTCELVLGILEEYTSERLDDVDTGYDEIVLRKKDRLYD